MKERFFRNRTAVFTVVFVLLVGLVGILAPVIAPNDPYETNILNKFASYSLQYPLGTDQLGRCVLSRMIYGIRPTLGLALLTMFGTISLGAILGIMAGYFRGIVEEVIMRVVDVMLSFPSQIMVFAVVALLGVSVQNVIIANVFIKWAWYARMIRTGVMQYRDRNFVQFSRCVGMPERFILFRHLLPSITSDLVVLASLDVGWAIINISTLSFLGLGVQAPTPEWGAMLNEAKNVMTSNPVQVLFDVSLAVKEGTCLGILGESGSGKSTMGRVLCGLLKPDSGEAVLDGVSVYASRAGRRNLQNKLSIVFQDYTTSANPRFRIRDIIGEGLTVQERREGKKLNRKTETSRLLELVGLPADFADRFPHELSGGQLQRVCIARAVACKPKIILFDEAISSLDAHTQVQVMDLLRELKNRLGLTYIFITHDLTSITYLCDDVLFLYQGRVTENLPVERISETKDEYARKLLESIVVFDTEESA